MARNRIGLRRSARGQGGSGASYPFTIGSVTPPFAAEGSGDTAITVAGGAFPAGAVVEVNGVPVATVFDSAAQLTATVPAAVTAVPGVKTIQVRDGAAASNIVSWPVVSDAPLLAAISPTAQNRYRSNFELTCTSPGAGNFTATSVVKLDGVSLATVFDSPTQLRATVPKASNLLAGAKNVTVSDTGGTSAPQVLTITPWTPSDIVGATGRFRVRSGEYVENPVGSIQTLTNLITPGTGNLTQATAANRPELIASDATFNGKPSIRKNLNVSQFLAGGTLGSYVTDTQKTLLLVGTVDAGTGSLALMFGIPGGTHGIHITPALYAVYRYRHYDGSFDETAVTPPVTETPALGTAQRMKGQHEGGNITMDVNGTVSAPFATGASLAPQMGVAINMFLASAVAVTQRMCEAVLINTAFAADDEDCWKNYVEDEYGIPA